MIVPKDKDSEWQRNQNTIKKKSKKGYAWGLGLRFAPSQTLFSSSFISQKTENISALLCAHNVFCDRNWELNGPASLLSSWGNLGTPTGILSLFFDHTQLNCSTLCGPFEVQSPSEPLNWGQGGQQEIWLPQQLETGSVGEVSGDMFLSGVMMLKRQWRLGIG